MKILLEEVHGPKGSRWEVAVVPTTKEDTEAGPPSGAVVAQVLLGVAQSLLANHIRESSPEQESSQIVIPKFANLP